MIAAVGKNRAVSGTAAVVLANKSFDLRFRLMWPDLYLMDLSDSQLRGTGFKHYIVMSARKTYVDEGDHYELPTTLLIGLAPLLREQDDSYKPAGEAKRTTFAKHDAYAFTLRSTVLQGDEMTVYADAKTFYPLGASHVSQGKSMGGAPFYIDLVYTKLDFKTALNANDFKWSPPADYTEERGR